MKIEININYTQELDELKVAVNQAIKSFAIKEVYYRDGLNGYNIDLDVANDIKRRRNALECVYTQL